jgi:hypothetical protein
MKLDIRGGRAALLAAAFAGLVAGACTSASRDASRSTSGTAAKTSSAQTASATDLADTPRQRLPDPGKAWVIFGTDTVNAEVARTAQEREKGLMYRESVPAGTGMLFIFDQMGPQSFWMENTYVPLDIAFMDTSYRVVDIQQMERLTTDPHQSAAPAMFALEVPKGWFEAHGVHVGSVPEVEFGPQLGQ